MQSIKKKIQDKNTSITSKEGGFTIIEVMIVLVIAAVIILIVFLAVPALQRNSRNNQRNNDASRLLTAADEYRAHNQNNFPEDIADVMNISGELAFYNYDENEDNSDVHLFPDPDNMPDEVTTIFPIGVIQDSNIVLATRSSCHDGTSVSSGNSNIVIYFIETGGDEFEGRCI